MLNRTPRLCSRCQASVTPPEDASPAAIPDFTPVPRVKPRHDGWTPSRQRGFIDALADTGSVAHAAQAINMSTEGAYALRRQPGASGFAAAWDAALDHGVGRLVAVTMERAIHGVAVPIFYHGQQIGERRKYNDRLAMFHLRHRLPDRYGPAPRLPGAKAPEDVWSREAADAEQAESDALTERLRVRLETFHVRWRSRFANDPAKVAAYVLLFGVDGTDDARQGEGIRFSRFPPELSHALMGLSSDEEESGNAALRLALGYDQPA